MATPPIDRRTFLRGAAASASAAALTSGVSAHRNAPSDTESPPGRVLLDDFDRPDSMDLGPGWETLNPGYWQVQGGRLRRRLHNVGERARNVDRPSWSFPYHWETHGQEEMRVEYDPSLPPGLVFRRDWLVTGGFTLEASFVIEERSPVAAGRELPAEDDPGWLMHRPDYGLLGLAFGARSQLESFGKAKRAIIAGWRDDGTFGLFKHKRGEDEALEGTTPIRTEDLPPGTELTVRVKVSEELPLDGVAMVRVESSLLIWSDSESEANDAGAATLLAGPAASLPAARLLPGYVGLAGRGLLDFAIDEARLEPSTDQPLVAPRNELHVAYALGDTLALQRDSRTGDPGAWTVRFVCLFRSEGERAEVRIATDPAPPGGWESVPAAGEGEIVTNAFRHHTALVDTALPAAPEETTLYYTVWKDGVDVTADPRIGTDAVGPGTGLVPGVPGDGGYVGRLPKLTAPYRVCGLSCHAISGGNAALEGADGAGPYQVHDQPTEGAYALLEDFGYQVMLWEDDVWYLELYMFPPSTDDAYKIITLTMAGPTTRWQAMRHWNVLNPGDHDFGMDDVKGPEQLAVRNIDGLGQDREYLARNFQIVQHLMQGLENPSSTDNPKRWRRWRMPAGDAALFVCDGRLWRSSQDTAIWDDEGWGPERTGTRSTYPRTDPTRTLLGEEQFAWLTETLRSEPAELVMLTGINGLHTIWNGVQDDPDTGKRLANRDRVAADYAGWVAAGADRVLALLSERPGVVSVYGDVHVGSIVENEANGLVECSFGPIGRHGGRTPKEGFGPRMVDHDGRPVRVHALYHQRFGSPSMTKREGPRYWNVLDATLDPRSGPRVELTIRNLLDGPDSEPRGGSAFEGLLDSAPMNPTSRIPAFETLPEADVFLRTAGGRSIRAVRSDASGRVRAQRLAGIVPGARILALADDGRETRAAALVALAPA